MRAVRVDGGHVRVADVPTPDGPGVRVRVASAGICGSDLHVIAEDSPVRDRVVTAVVTVSSRRS